MGRNEKAAMQAGADAMAHAFAGERSELLSVIRVLYHALEHSPHPNHVDALAIGRDLLERYND